MTGSTAAPKGRDGDRTEQHRTPDQQRTEKLDGPPAYGKHGTGRARSLYWLLPTLAFVLGLLLGGSVIAAADLGSSNDPPVAAVPPVDDPVPAEPGERTITVPASCVDGLDRADAAAEAARDGIDAIRRIDTAALQRVLDRLQVLQPQIADLAGKCRAAATDGS